MESAEPGGINGKGTDTMESGLFRKKSLEKISSPEGLHDYLRVTSPRLWMVLGCIVLLLVGFLVYASTARMENTMKISVDVQSFDTQEEYRAQGGAAKISLVSARLPIAMSDTVDTGMKVRIGEYAGTVSWVAELREEQEISVIIDMDHGFLPLPDGMYDAELVLESATPISFLWN